MKKVILFLSVALLGLTSCSTRIDAGHEGILIKQYGSDKGVQDVSLVTGRVWYNPWTEDVDQYPTFVQTVDYDLFEVNAKDGSSFKVDPTLSFNIVQGNSPQIFRKYRKSLEEVSKTTILNYVKDAFRLQMNKYTTDEIVSNREQFESAVQKTLAKVLEDEGFKLEQLTSGLQYPQTIVDAVNDKNKMIQEAMGAKNKLLKDSIQAQSKIIIATAEKKANDLKQTSLTPMLIQQMFIEKWDGRTPLYGNAPTLFKNIQ
jgi:regulator of protease activity HflC (stomatin/prohibitin superfamily)